LNRLREELFQYHAVSVAGFVFQACSFNHSDISPRLESISYERSNKDYRTRRRFPAGLPPSPFLSGLTRRERGHRLGIVSDLLTSRDHLRRQDIQWPLSVDPLVRPSVFFSGIFKRPELGYRGRSGDRRGEVLASFRRDAHPLRLPSSIGTRGVFIGELLSEKEDDGRRMSCALADGNPGRCLAGTDGSRSPSGRQHPPWIRSG
jgi:hypothetical protein